MTRLSVQAAQLTPEQSLHPTEPLNIFITLGKTWLILPDEEPSKVLGELLQRYSGRRSKPANSNGHSMGCVVLFGITIIE